MTTVQANREEAIGKVLRDLRDRELRRDELDAELSRSVVHLRTAATQIEMLIDGQRSNTGSPLAHLDLNRLVCLLADREEVQTRISNMRDELHRLRSTG